MASESALRPTRTLLVDDNERALLAVRLALRGEYPRIAVVGEAHSIVETVETARFYLPDVILLADRLGGQSALYALPVLRRCCARWIVVLTGFRDYARSTAALSLGADIVLTKGDSRALIEAIGSLNRTASLSVLI